MLLKKAVDGYLLDITADGYSAGKKEGRHAAVCFGDNPQLSTRRVVRGEKT